MGILRLQNQHQRWLSPSCLLGLRGLYFFWWKSAVKCDGECKKHARIYVSVLPKGCSSSTNLQNPCSRLLFSNCLSPSWSQTALFIQQQITNKITHQQRQAERKKGLSCPFWNNLEIWWSSRKRDKNTNFQFQGQLDLVPVRAYPEKILVQISAHCLKIGGGETAQSHCTSEVFGTPEGCGRELVFPSPASPSASCHLS